MDSATGKLPEPMQPFFDEFLVYMETLNTVEIGKGKKIKLSSPDKGDIPTFGLIEEGLFKCLFQSGDERSRTGWIGGDKQWFGFENVYYRRSGFQYETLIDTRLKLFTLDDLKRFEQFQILSIAVQYSIMNASNLWLRLNQTKSLHQRVVAALLELRTKTVRPEIEVTITDIADFISSARTKVSPIISKLESAGLVEKGYKNYLIADEKILRNYYKAEFSTRML